MDASDLTGLGKLADSKLVNKAYKDGLSPATQELGKLATDVVKSFRLFLAPVQLLSVAQDRLAGFLERIRNDVPEERQIDAAPSIAGPVLQRLVYVEDDNPLLELYLNLLKRAIDKERVSEAHPAFPRIIEQLSPDEALALYVFKKGGKLGYPDFRSNDYFIGDFPRHLLHYPDYFSMYMSHLRALDLVTMLEIPPRASMGASIGIGGHWFPAGKSQPASCELTPFGRLFANACVPDTGIEIDLQQGSAKQQESE